MKKIFVLILSALMFVGVCSAQQRPPKNNEQGKMPKIEEIVKDLSVRQKRQLETISNETKVQMDKYKAELKQVKDSIHYFMDMPSDKSDVLFPLYDREAKIKANMSKLMYRTRLKIDNVLTKEQLKVLNDAMTQKRKNGHK